MPREKLPPSKSEIVFTRSEDNIHRNNKGQALTEAYPDIAQAQLLVARRELADIIDAYASDRVEKLYVDLAIKHDSPDPLGNKEYQAIYKDLQDAEKPHLTRNAPPTKEKSKKDAKDSGTWQSELKKKKGKKTPNPEAPILDHFLPEQKPPTTWKDELQVLKEKQARLRRLDNSQEFARVRIESKLPIGIVLTADWHMGADGTDYEAWEKDMTLIQNEPNAFMAVASNTIDNFIFPSGMFEQMEDPDVQADMIKSFARDFKGKFLAIAGSRCHEGWTQQRTGIDLNYQMFKDTIEMGTPWFPNGGVVEIDLNGIKYTLGIIHKTRFHSALNPTNANRQLHDLRWPVDVVAVAHHHIGQVLQTDKYEGPFEKPVVFVRIPGYKRKDAYGEGEGFGQGGVGSPIVILDPNKKNMVPFINLKDGISYLQVLRELEGLKK